LETKHSYKSRYWWATRLCFFGTEHAKGRKEGDLKEFWHFGQYVGENSKYASEYPNVVVKELPRFNAVGKEAYKCWKKLYVLRALARLGLDEFYFDNYAKDGNSILRPIHYAYYLRTSKCNTRRCSW
jgi:isopenicillin N synthase-like dioxygenase